MGYLQDYVGFEEGPDSVTKVNVLLDFWTNPCDAPWTVYLKTLYPVLGRLAIILVETDLLDILRAYLRPRMGLTRGPNRTKGRRGHYIRGLPGSEDLVARLIPGKELHYARVIGANEAFLWQIDGVIQRGLWLWLVVDMSVEGFYWWSQGIRLEGYCKPNNKPALFATDATPNCVALAGQWLTAGNFSARWIDPDVSISQAVVVLPLGNWLVTYTATYTGVPPAAGTVSVRITGPGVHQENSVTLADNVPVNLTVSAAFPGPKTVGIDSRLVGDLTCTGTDAIIIARRM